jgi:hypothetical protein
MLEHRYHQADWYVWLDSTFKIKDEYFIDRFITMAEDTQLLLYRHPERNSIKEELEIINAMILRGDKYMLKRYSGEPIKEQVEYYLNDSAFVDNKLFAMGFFAYHKSISKMLEEWFIHNAIWSIQDQISFPYVLDKFSPSYKIIDDGNIFQNSFVSHKYGRESNSLFGIKMLLKNTLKTFNF